MTDFKVNKAGMKALEEQVAQAFAVHMNAVATEVAATHSGRPVAEVSDELVRRGTGDGFVPVAATVVKQAEAISAGEKPPPFRP